MAKQISSLWVGLTGNVSGLAKSFSGALGPVRELRGALSGLNGILASVGVGLSVGFIANEFKSLVHSSLEGIDSVAKLSDRLGIATEALTGLQHAGNLAGISAEDLTGGLEKMLRALNSAATTGKGPAFEALESMGLSARTLFNLKPDKAFAAIADGLSKIQNPAARAAATVAIFGKSGQALLPLLMSGSEGIRAMQLEAEKLGLTFSRVDAAKVEEANDALSRVSAAFTGIGNVAAVQLAPYIEAAAKSFTDFATQGQGVSRFVLPALEGVAKGIGFVADFVDILKTGWKGMQAGATSALASIVSGLATAIDSVNAFAQKFGGVIAALPGQSEGTVKAMQAAVNIDTSFLKDLSTGLRDEAAKLDDEFDRMFSGPPPSAKIGRFFDDIRERADEAARAATTKSAPGFSGILDAIGRDALTFKERFLEAAAGFHPAAIAAAPAKALAKVEPPRELKTILAGSAEAQALRFKAPGLSPGMKDADKQIANQQKQLAEATRQTTILQGIKDNTAAGAGGLAVASINV